MGVTDNVTVNFKANTSGFTQGLRKAGTALSGMGGRFNQATLGSNKMFNSTARLGNSMVFATVKMLAMRQVLKLVAQSFTRSFRAVEDFNLGVASSASLVTTFMKFKPGEALAEGYERASRYAKDVQLKFVEINKNTLATAKQMGLVNRELQKQGVFLDINKEKQVKGFEAFTNAIAILTAGMPDANRQFGQEARALMEGLARQGTTLSLLVKKKLGSAWKSVIDQWKHGGVFFENMGELLKGFSAGTEKLTRTWKVISSTIQSTANNILRLGFEDTFDLIIDQLVKFNKLLLDNQALIGTKLKRAWATLTLNIVTLFNNIKPLVALIAGSFVAVVKVASRAIEGLNTIMSALNGNLGEYLDKVNEISKLSRREVITLQLRGVLKQIVAIEDLIDTTKKLGSAYGQVPGTLSKVGIALLEYQRQLAVATKRQAELKQQLVDLATGGPGSDKPDVDNDPFADIKTKFTNYADFVKLKQGELALFVNKSWVVAINGIEKALGGFFSSLSDDTKTFTEKWVDFTKNILKIFVDMVAQLIAKWLMVLVLTGGNVGLANAAVSAGANAFSGGGSFTPSDIGTQAVPSGVSISSASSIGTNNDAVIMTAAIISKIESITDRPLQAELLVGDDQINTLNKNINTVESEARELGI